MIIVSSLLLFAGLLFTYGNKWLCNTFYKPRYHSGSDDFEDIIAVIGFMILFFGLSTFIYSIIHFSPAYFTWIGLIIGIIVSLIHLNKCYVVFKESDKDKYSGFGSGMCLLGCLGLFVFPFIGFITGFILKSILI